MLIEKVKNIVKEKFESSSGCHDWDHTLRVWKLCEHIGEKENADMEILELAAVLHDIGREKQDDCNGKICHAEEGAKMAREILEKEGLDSQKIDKVVHCIETHRFRKKRTSQSVEARVLFDADKLDSIGAIGIGRAFVFSGEIGARVHNKDVDPENTLEYSKDDTAYREFLVKLSKIKDRMLTKEGKKFAEERHDFMVEFFKRLNQESEGRV